MNARPGCSPEAAAAHTGPAADRPRLVLITGMSGAGKTTALKALEDIGYEAVDNLPLSLLEQVLRPVGTNRRPLAVDVDIRTRDFSPEAFAEIVEPVLARGDYDAKLLFIDCDDEVLRCRYTETRRRHPLASDRPVIDGIQHERRLVAGLGKRADLVIDTTHLAAADLRRLVAGNFALDDRPSLSVFVTSFSYRLGLPREADLVFDARFLANPHYDERLRPLTGRHREVGAYIEADPGFQPFFDGLVTMLLPLLPRFETEGKSYLTIAIGCTGGRHRSVFVAERLAAVLKEHRERVRVHHRDMFEEAPRPAREAIER
ncbi:MAG: RNase adapter RapZ [Alphaproteobacteria bacterium]